MGRADHCREWEFVPEPQPDDLHEQAVSSNLRFTATAPWKQKGKSIYLAMRRCCCRWIICMSLLILHFAVLVYLQIEKCEALWSIAFLQVWKRRIECHYSYLPLISIRLKDIRYFKNFRLYMQKYISDFFGCIWDKKLWNIKQKLKVYIPCALGDLEIGRFMGFYEAFYVGIQRSIGEMW